MALDRKNPPFIPQKTRDGSEFAKGAKDGHPQVQVGYIGDLEFGNMGEEGLVRGAEFVMIWRFLASRGYSAASCSATQRNCCARIHPAFPRL